MFCRNCGNNCPDGAMFCTNCGTSLNTQPTQPVQEQPVYQQPVYQQTEQQTYQQPVSEQPAQEENSSTPGFGLSIPAMILGILSVVFMCAYGFAIPCGIAGIIMSSISLSKGKKVGKTNGMAVAGLICAIVGLALSVIMISAAEAFWEGFFEGLGGYEYYGDFSEF